MREVRARATQPSSKASRTCGLAACGSGVREALAYGDRRPRVAPLHVALLVLLLLLGDGLAPLQLGAAGEGDDAAAGLPGVLGGRGGLVPRIQVLEPGCHG